MSYDRVVEFASPPLVGPDSVIRVIAPSGPFDLERFEAGVAFLRQRYEVRYDDPTIHCRDGFLAGDDERRLKELRDALMDPEAVALVAARGGYGATRLLDRLHVDEIRRANKWLVGFSDVTALHALWARAATRSLHGPMVAWLGSASDLARAQWIAALEGTHPPIDDLWSLGTDAVAEGHLVGGNLAVLAALAGTPHTPPLTGAILFLEEVGEAPYRIDRMLTTLRQAGWFDRVHGVLLGDFTACVGRHGVKVTDVLVDRLGNLGLVVLGGAHCGHGPLNRSLPFGAHTRLDTRSGVATFL